MTTRLSPHMYRFRPLLLPFLAVIAFLLRSIPYGNYLDGQGGYLFFGPDSYDHLRKIFLTIQAFPGLPPHDYYYGYPQGLGQVWAPLFDYLLALLALVAGWGAPSSHTVEMIGFWFPPILAGVTVFLVHSAGTRFFGRTAGGVAAVVFALLPAHILYSFVSRLDHHVAEPVVCLLIVISLLKGIDSAPPAPAGWRAPVSTALVMVLALLIWRGSVIFWGVVTAALLVHLAALGLRTPAARAVARYGFKIHLAGVLMLLPICGLNLWGTAGGVTAGIVSWFHVLLLGSCSVVFLLLATLSRGNRRFILPLLATALVLLYLVLPAGRGFVGEFFAGLDVIVGSDPWLAAISELTSLLYYQTGRLDLWYPAENFSLVYWLFPVVLLMLLARWRQGGWREFRYPLFLVWGIFFWILPLFRLRYCHLTAVTVALAAGFLSSVIKERWPGEGARGFLVPSVVLLLLMAPVVSLLKIVPDTAPDRAVKYDLKAALAWLRDNTQTTSFFQKPDRVPEYGVLADWGLGAHIVNMGHRPALATNFGWEAHGLFQSAAFQSLGDPVAATGILDANRIRYVLLNQVIGSVEDDRAIAEFGYRTGRFKVQAIGGGYSLQSSMYYRLLARDGGAYDIMGLSFPALGCYRLVYESSTTALFPTVGDVSLFKIFERVPGAVITGTGPAGAPIQLQLGLNSPIGRTLVYRDRATVGADGRFAVGVPYPTTVTSGILKPLGDYLVTVGGRPGWVQVTENDVYDHRSVRFIPAP